MSEERSKHIKYESPPLEQALVWLKANGGDYSEIILGHINQLLANNHKAKASAVNDLLIDLTDNYLIMPAVHEFIADRAKLLENQDCK